MKEERKFSLKIIMNLKISILICFLAACQVQSDEVIQVQPRLIGTEVTDETRPQNNVAIFANDSPDVAICSGALIHYKWIATAASCVSEYSFTELKYKLGGALVAPGQDSSHYEEGALIYEIIVHPSYVEATRTNDIALINTIDLIAIQPYKITRTNPNILNLPVILRGYGAINRDLNEVTRNLYEQQTTLSNIGQCTKYERVPTNKLCSVYGRVCRGDQGGALVKKSSTNELIGIISVPVGAEEFCGTTATPIETYTNIFLYRQWIIQSLGLVSI